MINLSTYKKYLIVAVGVALCALSAWLAYSYQKAKYESQIADLKAQMASAVAAQEKTYAEKLAKATNELVIANRNADTLRRDRDRILERLRSADSRQTERASTDSGKSFKEEYAQCRRLLSESIDLLVEGDELVRGIAVEKDALSEIVK